MKNINIIKTLLLLVSVLFIYSCTDNETYPETRLFRPVLNKDLSSINNTIIVDMGKMKSAVYYKIEISRDTFKTVLKSVDTPENKYVFKDLLWNTLYQVRATAIAETEEFNSKVSDFGGIKTVSFPSILQAPDETVDLSDVAAKIRWLVVAGQEVTSIKMFAGSDEALTTPLATYNTTPAEILAGQKIISGLTPGTKYQFAIYSNGVIKGWNFYTTKPAIPITANTIDLTGNTDPNILITTLKDPATVSGTTIILDGDMTYNGNGYAFDKSITIKSGYSVNTLGATINITSNFNLVAGSSISSIVFDGITFKGTASTYIFNINVSGSVEDMTFNNCRISTFRGIIRAQGSNTGHITNFKIDSSIVNDIKDYGVINMDTVGWNFSNLMLTNSTFYQCQKFIVSKSTTNSKSILISDCTLNEETAINNKIFVFPATINITDGVVIRNTIIGRGWDMAGGATTFGIDPIDGLPSTNFTVTNSFATSDFTYSTGGTQIPGFPNAVYGETTLKLWINPAIGNFNFKDSSFLGIKNSGDPRWRKQ